MRAVTFLAVLACTDDPSPSPDDLGHSEDTDDPSPPDTDDTDTAPTDTDLPPPNTFSAPFLWAPLVLDGAIDLGHVPAPVAAPVEPGPIALTRIVPDGLDVSVSGGDPYGVGIAFVDVDSDGWDDLFVASGLAAPDGAPSSLWRNAGDGTFVDVSVSSGVDAIFASRDALSVAAGDVDADGDVDLYVGAHPTDVLLLNDGDGTFTDGTAAAGAGGPSSDFSPSRSKIVGLGDYDADGHLDIVSASNTFVGPVPNLYVLRGLGGGAFEDVTSATGAFAPSEGTPCAVMWTDHDADGHGDVAIWNDFGDPDENRVLLRSTGTAFSNVAGAVGWTNSLGAPMGIDAADVDRDDWIDFFVGDAGSGMFLLSNADGTWIDWTAAAYIDTPNSWGLGFEDLDADGWWDLFAAQSGPFPHLVYRNLRSDPPTFGEIELLHPAIALGNVAAGFADFDHDGDVDVALAATGGENVSLLRNDTLRGTARSLEVRIVAAPEDGAAGGVTARVVVSVGGEILWRDITGGSSRASQNALSARFGLGHHSGAEWVGVSWPDGRQIVAANVPGDATVLFDGEAATVR